MSEKSNIYDNFVGLRKEYRKQRAQQGEIFTGEVAVREGLRGLRAKLTELQKRLDKEKSSKYPDLAMIKRIENKILEIGAILNNPANCNKIPPKMR